jgi:hypothetical protein
MPSAGFEPATLATKRPQTYVLHSAATEVGMRDIIRNFLSQRITYYYCHDLQKSFTFNISLKIRHKQDLIV